MQLFMVNIYKKININIAIKYVMYSICFCKFSNHTIKINIHKITNAN